MMRKAKIEIEGMHCASCAANIERSLSKTTGINNAHVSLLLKKGACDVADNVKDEDIVNAVKRAGYKVRKINYE
jgi:Cu+-exporting ATPase